jgi:uroporphyrinogen III methyltransferase/synthase
VFASTSAVENFVKMTDARPQTSFCIGRMTEAAARKHGFETVTSDETTMDSLVKKITEYFYLA